MTRRPIRTCEAVFTDASYRERLNNATRINARRTEKRYARKLSELVRKISLMIKDGFDPTDPMTSSGNLRRLLGHYSEAITPWAKSVATRMVAEVDRTERAAWLERSEEISRLLERDLTTTHVGRVVEQQVKAQTDYIKDLPVGAAERIQELSVKALYEGGRDEDLAKKIMEVGHVTEGRAKMLARTGVGTATTALTEARAKAVGSEGYIWRTSKDEDVRASHKKMEGKFVRWDQPPTLEKMTGHAGTFPNCRCYPEPVFPDL